MYYPEELVEEVRARNDIVDVVSGYVRMQKKGANYFGLCPFHNEKSPSFSVSPAKQMYYCFGCGAGGNVLTFVMEYENYTFPEALKFLADRAGVKLCGHPLSHKQYSGLQRQSAEYFLHYVGNPVSPVPDYCHFLHGDGIYSSSQNYGSDRAVRCRKYAL